MTGKMDQVNTECEEIKSLIEKDFLTLFQKENYKYLLKKFQGSAENYAVTYDVCKSRHDRLPEGAKRKEDYKEKYEEAKHELAPFLTSLRYLKSELTNMEQLIKTVNEIKDKIEALQTSINNIKPEEMANQSLDLTHLNNKLNQIEKLILANPDNQEAIAKQNEANFWGEIASEYLQESPIIKKCVGLNVADNQLKGNVGSFYTDPELFIKACQEQPIGTAKLLIKYNEKFDTWGIIYILSNGQEFTYASPNPTFNQEWKDAANWIKSKGIIKHLSPTGNHKAINTDPRSKTWYSFIWSLVFMELLADAFFNNLEYPDWSTPYHENKWLRERTVMEAEVMNIQVRHANC